MAATSPLHALVADIIDRCGVRTFFQPLVHLKRLEVVGFEALDPGARSKARFGPYLRCHTSALIASWTTWLLDD